MKGFRITRGSNIFGYILDSRFCQHQLEIRFGRQPGACNVNQFLRNLGYNNNSTQN